MEQIKEISYFFNFSEPKQLLLIECIELFAPNADKKKKLKDVYQTPWIERATGMDTFEELFTPIIHCLEKMKFNKNNKRNRHTSVKASSFSH